MNFEFDHEIVREIINTIAIDAIDGIPEKRTLALPWDQYQRHLGLAKKGLRIETYEDRGVGISLLNVGDKIEIGKVIHYIPQRGYRVHFSQKVDIYCKVFEVQDILIILKK